ncbi:MAG: xanthine dehydrogenase family protein molybdopterin-binding subunit [Rhodospirillales bacterium]
MHRASFAPGQPVPRREDHRFLTGTGRYVADIAVDNETVADFLRSPYAHAEIVRIETAEVLALPGVLAIFTAADTAADGLGDVPCAIPVKGQNGEQMPRPGRPLLARSRVRFVGEPLAMVVATSRDAALDALERIAVSYRELPAVVTFEDAMAADASPIWADAPGNVAFFWQRGDRARVDTALAAAPHLVQLELVNNRLIPSPMEPRAALGLFDVTSGRYTLYTSSQGAHAIRDQLSQATLKVPAELIRVIVPDVGGGFGSKIFHYPEEALVLWAARRVGRPVKWVGERMEACAADTHGRDQQNRIVAGFDDDGRCLALRVDTLANMGAFLNAFGPAVPSQMTGCMLSGAYAIPAIHATCRGVYTNTVPVDAYRGAGRPEAAYMLERLMDRAARTLGLDTAEIRRRNFIRPEAMPYKTASGPTYDDGRFAETLDAALAAADWDGFARRRQDAAMVGRLRGIGLSTYVEICAFEAEEAHLLFPEAGGVELRIGTQSTGQGHETAYAQLVAGRLGVPFDAIRVIQGDTDLIPTGNGTSGSRSIPVGGPAVNAACDAVLARGRRFAAHLLQADAAAIELGEDGFRVAGSGRRIGLLDLAAAARSAENLPAGETPGLDASGTYDCEASTFPYGCHVAEVEIDPDTGAVTVVRYTPADDFGVIINPLLVAGQVQGGVAQGIGQALLEEAVYDRGSGQLVTASFLDYALPHASDVPAIRPAFTTVPCRTNPLGSKGAGEAGAIAACPAVINALLDALAARGVTHIDMPATPERVWRALNDSRGGD